MDATIVEKIKLCGRRPGGVAGHNRNPDFSLIRKSEKPFRQDADDCEFRVVQGDCLAGYVGVRAKDLSDWASYGSGLLGLQRVDKSRATVAFRMDDRKQRIIVTAAAAVILKEKVSVQLLLGALIITAGVILVSLS